jgi:hypothetical protein
MGVLKVILICGLAAVAVILAGAILAVATVHFDQENDIY